MDITKIISTINNHGGVARPNLFRVLIPSVNESLNTEDLSLLAESTDFPGFQFQANETRPTGYGHHEKRPYDIMYGDVNITFIVDGNFDLLNFFHSWKDKIYDHEKTVFSYPEEYMVDIEITQFNTAGEEKKKIKLLNAFPLGLSSIPLSWGDQNTYEKLSVSFAYESWKDVDIS